MAATASLDLAVAAVVGCRDKLRRHRDRQTKQSRSWTSKGSCRFPRVTHSHSSVAGGCPACFALAECRACSGAEIFEQRLRELSAEEAERSSRGLSAASGSAEGGGGSGGPTGATALHSRPIRFTIGPYEAHRPPPVQAVVGAATLGPGWTTLIAGRSRTVRRTMTLFIATEPGRPDSVSAC